MTVRWLAVTLVLASLLTACSSQDKAPQSKPSAAPTATSAAPASGGMSYVALGDSFTAGPGIDRPQKDAAQCFRSDHNYPSALAKELGISDFTDVSCAGATTADLLAESAAAQPAQLDAVGADTSLVTVGIGGNDEGLFASLLGSCSNQSADICSDFVGSRLPQVLKATQQSVAKTLEAVQDRAPKAKVILVGYLTLAAEGAGCPGLPIQGGGLSSVITAEKSLDTMLAGAAKDAGVDFVSMRTASAGHDVCSGDKAWANGTMPETGEGIMFHPNTAGMQAVADRIRATVGS